MSKSTRALRIESLEQKQMLAGDITVGVVGGVLTLQGDELANHVVVTSGEDPGTFIIRGLEDTQIILADAAPASEVVVEGVRALAARMGRGDDVLRIQDAHIRGNVAIGMGAGNDRVVVGVGPETTPAVIVDADANVKIGRNLTIRTDGGNDTALVASTYGRGVLNVSTGEGNDTVRIGHPEPTTSLGDQRPASTDNSGRPDVNFGLGVHVNLGAGDDTLGANSLRTGAVQINGGEGADDIRIARVQTHAISITGGRGEDTDRVALHNVETGLLFAALGDGDDSLMLGGVKARLAVLSGGPGNDVLTLLAGNMIRHRLVSGFETINRADAPTTAA